MKHLIVLALIVVLLAACAPAPTPASPDEPVTSEPSQPPVNTPSNPEPAPANPYAPQPGDETLARSSAFMSSADLLIMESFPVQIALILSGNLPTPCHDLRAVIHEPDNDNTIEVEIYSVSDPDAICVQVLQSFEARIPMGSFPAGHYTISVNGQRVGEFDS